MAKTPHTSQGPEHCLGAVQGAREFGAYCGNMLACVGLSVKAH